MRFFKYIVFFVIVFTIFAKIDIDIANAYEKCGHLTQFSNDPSAKKYSILDPINLGFSINEVPPPSVPESKMWQTGETSFPLSHFFEYLNTFSDSYYMDGRCKPVSSSVKISYFGMPRTDTTNVVSNVKEYRLTHVHREDKYAGSAPVIPVSNPISHHGEPIYLYQCPEGYKPSDDKWPGFYLNSNDYASVECSRFTTKETTDFQSITGDFGYGVSVNIPPLASGSFKDIASEDAVIEQIAKTGKMQITVEATQGSKTFDVPATNCVKISGNGPIKVVFMRGKNLNSGVSGFNSMIGEVINEGFSNIEPYKSYLNHFSFYADLLKGGNSCDFSPNINIRFEENDNDQQLAHAYLDGGLAIYNLAKEELLLPKFCDQYGTCTLKGRAAIVIHEVSHAFAGLLDEYLYNESGNIIDRFVDPNHSLSAYSSRNCSTKPFWSFRGADNKIYGSVTQKGCSFLYQSNNEPNQHPVIYYRPSRDSLMRGHTGSVNKFNVISCGYIIAAIKSENSIQANAQKYWPECLEMAKRGDVVMDGIPPPNPNTPKISTNSNTGLFGTITNLFASTPSISQASQVVIYGSNFTSENNVVKFVNKSTGKEYEVTEIPSTDGKSISFAVPADITTGTYSVKAGAFNSNWSNELTFNVLAAKAPTLTLEAIPSAVLLGQSSVISWISSGASSCIGTSSMDKPPSILNNPGTSGTFSFVATDKTSFTLTCTGPGGTTTKSVNITVGSFSKPTVSLKTTSEKITAGQGVTLSWSSSMSSSCKGTGTSDPATLLAWNKNQLITGSMYIIPKQNTSLSLTCNGNDGSSVSSTINIVVLPLPESQAPITPDIFASCITSAPKVPVVHHTNELITYTVNASGGDGKYEFEWSGDDGLIGNDAKASMFYFNTDSKPLWMAIDKIANVTVTSGNKSTTTQCLARVSMLSGGSSNTGLPYIGLNKTAALVGTKMYVSATPYVGVVGLYDIINPAIVIRGNGKMLFVRPDSINNYCTIGNGCSDLMTFTLPKIPTSFGTNLEISVISGGVYETNKVAFTLLQTIPSVVPQIPISVPTISSITPNSGPLNTLVTLSGTNFEQDTVVIASKGSATYTIVPTYTPAGVSRLASLSFNLASNSLTEPGIYTFKASNKGKVSNPIAFEVKLLQPTLQLTASSFSVTAGEAVTVSWSATNVSSCKGDSNTTNPNASWTSPATTDSFSFSPTSSTVLTLTCVGAGGTVTKSVSISVNPEPIVIPQPQPTVTLNVNPTSIYVDDMATISWSSTDANSCTSTGFDNNGLTSGNRSVSYSLPAKMIYSLSCAGPGGTTQRSATLTVRLRPENKPLPTINLSISPTTLTSFKGDIVRVEWSSTNAESCTFNRTSDDKGDAWSGVIGPISLSGSFEEETTGKTSFTVTCVGVGGTSSKTATVLPPADQPSVLDPSPGYDLLQNGTNRYMANVFDMIGILIKIMVPAIGEK